MASFSFDTVMTGTEMPGRGGAVFGTDPVRTPAKPSFWHPSPSGADDDAPPQQAGVPSPLLPLVPAAPLALPAVIPAITAALPALAPVAAAGAAVYGGLQALGLGEGGGLFGNNLLGGDDFSLGGLDFGGPGLPEPKAPYTEWHTGNKQFYHVPQYTSTGKYAGAKIAMYNRDNKKWKVWRLPKPHLAVIGKNMPRHQMITRLRRNLSRHTADAKTILKLVSPNSLATAKSRGYGGRHKHR